MRFGNAVVLACLSGVLFLSQACSVGSSRTVRSSTAAPSTVMSSPGTLSTSTAGPLGKAAATASLSAPFTSVTPVPSYILADPAFDPLPGARALYGTLAGATYAIEVPERWNGSLVLYAHGFVGNDPILFVQMPPLRRYFIEHGFAWAASSFAGVGYNPDQGVRDTLAVRDLFARDVGAPARTYIDGTSMGGHVVVSAMEQFPNAFAGGLSECGVVAGVEESDYIASYVTLGSFFSSTPLLPIIDTAVYRNAVRGQVLPALGPASNPKLQGKQFEDVIKNLTGGERPWRHQGFVERRTANFDLAVADDPKHPSLATRASTNFGVQYHIDPGLAIEDGRLNQSVLRVPADPEARNAEKHPDYAPRTGQLHAPLLTLHTTGDHFVPISQEQSYRRAVDAAGAGDLLVQRAIRRPGHCQFSQDELIRGFSDLVAWVEQGSVPDGDDFRNPDLRDAGRLFTSPLLPGDPGDE